MERPDMSGVLFANANKDSDNHPDYRGKVMVNNQLYYISGWKRSNDKENYISFKLRAAEGQPIL